MRVPTWIYVLTLVGLIIGNMKVYQTIFTPPVLKVNVFTVGRGTATLVQNPNRKTVLVDTGPDASILRALGLALPIWQRDIDAVILTSTKKNFAGGLPNVMSRYHVAHTYSDGTHFTLDSATSIDISSPGSFTISYGTSVFTVSSSTPAGVYVSDGKTVTQLD